MTNHEYEQQQARESVRDRVAAHDGKATAVDRFIAARTGAPRLCDPGPRFRQDLDGEPVSGFPLLLVMFFGGVIVGLAVLGVRCLILHH